MRDNMFDFLLRIRTLTVTPVIQGPDGLWQRPQHLILVDSWSDPPLQHHGISFPGEVEQCDTPKIGAHLFKYCMGTTRSANPWALSPSSM